METTLPENARHHKTYTLIINRTKTRKSFLQKAREKIRRETLLSPTLLKIPDEVDHLSDDSISEKLRHTEYLERKEFTLKTKSKSGDTLFHYIEPPQGDN